MTKERRQDYQNLETFTGQIATLIERTSNMMERMDNLIEALEKHEQEDKEVEQRVQSLELHKSKLLGICIGVSGTVGTLTGVIVFFASIAFKKLGLA